MPASLSPQEAALFRTLTELLADGARVEKDLLRVLVGSQGHELGRSYLALRSADLVEEVTLRPGFLRRLFGAKSGVFVSLTDTGREVAKGTAGQAEAETAPVAEIAVAPVQPVEAPVVLPEAPPKAVKAPPKPRKKEPKPVAVSPNDFTEVLGGAPVEPVRAVHDPVRLEGLAEMLGLTGFEITPAGQMLAERRWAEGRRDSEVALEILFVAVAHAVHLDGLGMAPLDRSVARAFFDEVEKEFSQLVAAGELAPEYLADKLGAVAAVLGPVDTAEPVLAGIMADPLLGMAPPAACPDEFFVAREGNAE